MEQKAQKHCYFSINKDFRDFISLCCPFSFNLCYFVLFLHGLFSCFILLCLVVIFLSTFHLLVCCPYSSLKEFHLPAVATLHAFLSPLFLRHILCSKGLPLLSLIYFLLYFFSAIPFSTFYFFCLSCQCHWRPK